MGKIKYLLFIVFILLVTGVNAQVNHLQVTDSTATSLYNSGDWKELIIFGGHAIKSGTDFPDLRLKIAYAWMMNGNFKKALKHYNDILSKNSYNDTARYYAYLCNKFLNNDLTASYNAGYLQNKNGLTAFSLIDAGVESSVKFNDDINRDNATYSRVSLSTRLSWRWELEQSADYYNQAIFKLGDHDGYGHFKHAADLQKEYYAKLSYAVNSNFSILGAYHYLSTNFKTIHDNSNLGFAGIKYAGNYVDIQADGNFGVLDEARLQQYNAKVTFYPLGNLDLYAISKASQLDLTGQKNYVYTEVLGFKLFKNTWLESSVTFGDQDDYLDADGLYIYNAIDKTIFKYGETIFYQPGTHLQLQFSYDYEKKYDSFQYLVYAQNSITLGALWKF